MKKHFYSVVIFGIVSFLSSVTRAETIGPFYIWSVNPYAQTGSVTYCLGGSGSGSSVGYWECSELDRYQWNLVTSDELGWYYIVNKENGKCLSRNSRKNQIRQYSFSQKPCQKSDFRLWAFEEEWGNILAPWDLDRDGFRSYIALKHFKAGYLSRKAVNNTFFEGSAVSTQRSVYDDAGPFGNSYPYSRYWKIGGNWQNYPVP